MAKRDKFSRIFLDKLYFYQRFLQKHLLQIKSKSHHLELNNINIGLEAGFYNAGDYNIFLGYQSGLCPLNALGVNHCHNNI